MIIDQIITGDARELIKDIPDNSIDLVFTDPVYDRIEDYEWLAQESARVLKDDRACLAWYGGPSLDVVISTMKQYIDWTWKLSYVVVAKGYRLIGYNLFVWTTPCLWFHKGKGYPHQRIPDTFISTAAPTGTYKWNKNIGVIHKWMSAFTEQGDIILDPFIGSGTTAVVAKQIGRHCIGFEIDPDIAEMARSRVELSQPSLFISSTQQELNL